MTWFSGARLRMRCDCDGVDFATVDVSYLTASGAALAVVRV